MHYRERVTEQLEAPPLQYVGGQILTFKKPTQAAAVSDPREGLAKQQVSEPLNGPYTGRGFPHIQVVVPLCSCCPAGGKRYWAQAKLLIPHL